MIRDSLTSEPLPLPEFMRWLESTQRERGRSLCPVNGSRDKGEPGREKFRLRTVTGEMLAIVWQRVQREITSRPASNGLVIIEEGARCPLDPRYIEEDMRRVFARARDFPISRLRAWSSRLVESITEELLSGPNGSEFSLQLLEYLDALGKKPAYWFRRTPVEHLSTGFHTAISAFFRMILAAPVSLWRAHRGSQGAQRGRLEEVLASECDLEVLTGQFLELAQYVATSHMVMLPVLDGIVWDSAGSTVPTQFELVERQGRLEPAVSRETVMILASRIASAPWTDPDEPRTGCPALGVSGVQAPVMREVREWCLESARRWFWPLVRRDALGEHDRGFSNGSS